MGYVTTLSVSQAKARLHELARAAFAHHERFTLTRKRRPEAVLISVDDLEGRETTSEVLADSASVTAIAGSLAERAAGTPGTDLATVRHHVCR
jgi:PHD/YefM family antitoxin component YafN of YafNO toxin-antitoxin module